MKKPNFKIKASIPWTGDEQPVHFAQPFAGRTTYSPEMLSRHCFITGQTGTGKTTSYVLPYCLATLMYKEKDDDKFPGGLVIDPKSELFKKLNAIESIRNRMIKLGEKGNRLNFFEFTSDSTSTRERMKKLFNLVAATSNGNDNLEHWRQMGMTLVCDLMEVQAAVERKSAAKVHKSMNFLADSIAMLRRIAANDDVPNKLVPDFQQVQHNVIPKKAATQICSGFDVALKNSLQLLREYFEVITIKHGVLVKASDHIDSLLDLYEIDLPNPLLCFASDTDLLKQVIYLQMSIQPELADLCSPDIESLVNLDPMQSLNANDMELSMRQCLDSGGVIVYQQGVVEPEIDKLVGKALKELFFRHIQSRTDMKQPIVYVCDEFHRYVSDDRNFGEPIFLSFCRSYRVMTCLCTQSVSALKLALASRRSGADHDAATQSILANFGMKIMMRSTDTETQQTAQSIYPFAHTRERPHVIEARPLSTLTVGESYFMTADGKCGREKVQLKDQTAQRMNPERRLTPDTKKSRIRCDPLIV